MPGVSRIVRIVVENDGGGIAGGLILAAALVIEPGLHCMGSDDFADVVIDVEGRVGVLVWELAVAIRSGDAGTGGVACVSKTGNAAELDVEELVGRVVRERKRKIEPEA